MRNAKITIWLIVVAICLGTSRINAEIVEWAIADGGNGHFYEAVFVPEGIDWEIANVAAIDAGGYLATITSSEENAFVFDLVDDDPDLWYGTVPYLAYLGPWLGGFQSEDATEPDGGWEWVTGEPFTYTNWSPAQPDDRAGVEDYLHFNGYDSVPSPNWNDFGPDIFQVHSYVVEYIPEPSTLLLLGLGAVLLRRKRR